MSNSGCFILGQDKGFLLTPGQTLATGKQRWSLETVLATYAGGWHRESVCLQGVKNSRAHKPTPWNNKNIPFFQLHMLWADSLISAVHCQRQVLYRVLPWKSSLKKTSYENTNTFLFSVKSTTIAYSRKVQELWKKLCDSDYILWKPGTYPKKYHFVKSRSMGVECKVKAINDWMNAYNFHLFIALH